MFSFTPFDGQPLTQPSWWKYLLLSKLFGIWLLAFLWRDKMNDKYVYSAIMSMLSILAGIIIMSAVAIIY
ncbi:hypothetical protein KSH_09745 (plasmid) [Moraxella osloensis]|nr:hypothetical protein KSH_09745 [Moraxella osloensis]